MNDREYQIGILMSTPKILELLFGLLIKKGIITTDDIDKMKKEVVKTKKKEEE